MKDNQQRKLKVTPMRGSPGIYKVSVWSEEKQEYVSPRSISSCRQKFYRAVRWVKALGKRRQQGQFFNSLEEARAWRMQANPEPLKVQEPRYTIQNLLEDWREWSKPPRLQQSTWDVYGKDIVHLKPLHDVSVSELTSQDVDLWLKALLDPKYPKKADRVSFLREVTTLTTVLNWYRERKNNQFLPPILKRHRTDCFFKRKPPKEDMSLSVAELERFLERLKNHHKPVYYYLASFQAMCGARIDEACGLEWSAVDLENASVEIRQICSWDFITRKPSLRKGTKTGEIRRIVIPQRLVELMSEWRKIGAHGNLVFHKDGSLLKYNAIQSVYKKAYRVLGLPERSTHVLRHSFGTIHADQTNDIRATQAAMGHKDLRITQHYAKVAERNQRMAIENFAFGRSKSTNNPQPPAGSNVIPLVIKKSA